MTETDIAKMAMKSLEAAVDPDRVQALLDEQVQKTVDEAIRNGLKSYGPFGRKLEEKVKEALDVNSLELPTYGVMVTGLVERFIKNNMAAIISERLEEDLKELLNIAPQRVKLCPRLDSRAR